MISSYIPQFKLQELRFLVTGGAGFIGSNLVYALLSAGASLVRVLDNFSTGSLENLLPYASDKRLEIKKGDIRDSNDCLEACEGIDIVFHTAALGSVPRSLNNPWLTHEVNSTGFIHVAQACMNKNVRRLVFSSSSSVYGQNNDLPVKETYEPRPFSPYAVSKLTNELYADVFHKNMGLQYIGLRYFNVFGPNQNIKGPYTAVIPLFIQTLLDGGVPTIHGNGSISRDFTYVDNVVFANLLAATSSDNEAMNQIYNISGGRAISLLEMYQFLSKNLEMDTMPKFGSERQGDIKNSLADISKANKRLHYHPIVSFEKGLELTVKHYKEKLVYVESQINSSKFTIK